MKQRVQEMINEVSKVLIDVPELVHAGDPILRVKTKSVDFKEGQKIAQKLIDALSKYRNSSNGIGIGIAAPQIGIFKKVFVVIGKDGYEAYINPEIINYSKKTNFFRESCLSSRMFWNDVERSETVTIKWTDINGNENQEEFVYPKARLLQHEYDHLQGILCLDKAVPGTIEYSGNVKEEKFRNKPLK